MVIKGVAPIQPPAVAPDPCRPDDARADFANLVQRVEPPLRRALIAALGPQLGREATAEALAWAWEHRDRLQRVEHPVPYLYRVGRSKTRRRRLRVVYDRAEQPDLWVEPGLAGALADLTERQRVAVVLSVGYGWTQAEIAELLGIRATTVQNHVERGMARLRARLHPAEDAR